MIHAIGELVPEIAESAFVAWNAEVAGDAVLGEDSSVWFGTTIRADISHVRIGAGSNLQDGTVVHVNTDTPCIVGKNVTVGHRAVLHGCTIGDDSLIGMGAILLNDSEIGAGSIVGAGALVTQGKHFPPRSLLVGSPARLIREVTDEEYAHSLENAREYVQLAKSAKNYRRVDQ